MSGDALRLFSELRNKASYTEEQKLCISALLISIISVEEPIPDKLQGCLMKILLEDLKLPTSSFEKIREITNERLNKVIREFSVVQIKDVSNLIGKLMQLEVDDVKDNVDKFYKSKRIGACLAAVEKLRK